MKFLKETITDHVWLLIVYSLLSLCCLLMWSDKSHAETRVQIEQQIIKVANQNGIDPELALAIAEVESHFNPNAIGTHGEIGIYQLHPRYHLVKRGQTDQNIRLAIGYLAQLKMRCSQYGEAYFVCYNFGTTRKLKYPNRFPYYLKVKAVQRERFGFPNVASTR